MAWFQQGIGAMQSRHASRLVPPGFSASDTSSDDERAVITMRATSADSSCPCCGVVSRRVHSLYPRRGGFADRGAARPAHASGAALPLEAILCRRHIFAERFNDNILKPWARRTARLDQIIHCLALALGGRPAESFARRLSMPVSNAEAR